jgi:hypothetical protein
VRLYKHAKIIDEICGRSVRPSLESYTDIGAACIMILNSAT